MLTFTGSSSRYLKCRPLLRSFSYLHLTRMNMVRQIFVASFLVFSFHGMMSQDSSLVKKNTFFVEVGGSSYWYSLNYDRILKNQRKIRLSGRIGIMYIPPLAEPRQYIGIPLEFSWLKGSPPNHFEIGIGVTTILDAIMYPDSLRFYSLILQSSLRIGYRFQKSEGGFFFKAGITPIIFMDFFLGSNDPNLIVINPRDFFILPWAGVAAGWTLKN